MIARVGAPPITRSGAREAARQELSKGIYHRDDDSWTIRAIRAVLHWLHRAADSIASHAPGGGIGALALVALFIALLLLARWQLGPVRRASRAAEPLFGENSVQTADGYRRSAETAAAAGDWRTAVIARMRAVARGLEERHVITPRPGRTADELAEEVAAASPGSAEVVRAAAQVFDAIAYGDRAADAASYRTVVAADTEAARLRPRVEAML